MTNVDYAIRAVFGSEGGYSTDPQDKGNWTGGSIGVGQLKGTKYGISAASYPTLDIKHLTLAQADSIYRRNYWNKDQCDFIPWKLSYPIFDSAVLDGPGTAVIFLQKALGVKVDGCMGPATLAVLQHSDQDQVLSKFMANELAYRMKDKKWKRYGHGWTIRANRVAAGAYHPPPTDKNVKTPPAQLGR